MTISVSSNSKTLKFMIVLIAATLFSSGCKSAMKVKQMQAQSGFAEVNKTKIYYEIKGEGHSLFLIHGGLTDRRMWDYEFNILAKEYKIIRYDQRGYGKSEIPKEKFSYIEDLYHLLKFLDIDKTYILGGSGGGTTAIDFTIAHPDMVDALISVSSGPYGYPAADAIITAQKAEIYKNAVKINAQQAERNKAAEEEGLDKAIELTMKLPWFIPAENDAAITKKLRTMVKDNCENKWKLNHLHIWPSPPAIQRLSEIKIPTLVVVGDRDELVMLDMADVLATKIAGAKKEIIQNAAHHPNIEKPDEFNRIIADFLNNL